MYNIERRKKNIFRPSLSVLMKGRFLNLYDFSYRIENDMWSLGVIAFTLLSGMAPFDG